MDTSLLLGRPELRWWFSLTITYPLAHLRLDALTPGLQSKLASTSAARRPKLWRWQIYLSWQHHHRDGGSDMNIQAGPILWIKYGVPPLTVHVLSWTSITAASWQLSYIVKKFWRLTEKDLWKLSAFHTKSPRRILRIFLHNFISNKDLLEQCGKEPMATILTRRS